MKNRIRKLSLFILALIATVNLSSGQKGIPVPEMSALENDFVNWLDATTGSLGGSLAISKNGKLVYARSFGKADIGLTTDARPYNIYRIASMSKSVSSIMTMKLMQDGQLSMNDKVFGPTGILNDPYYNGITIPDQAALYSITVKHLLEHTSGINTHAPSLLEMTAKFGEPNPGKIQTFVKYMMTQPLEFTPGTSVAYNNQAFVVLAAVIEKKSGMSFNDYLKFILRPVGIHDISLAKSLMMQKQEREAEYPRHPSHADRDAIDCSFYGDNSYLPAAYGGVYYELASGAGGVMGTPKDLVKLINAVDNFTGNPKLLLPFARDTMFRPRTIFPDYAKGWGVNSQGEFYHNGGGPGHISAWGHLRSSSGDSWGFAVIVNGSETPGQNIEGDVVNIIRNNMNTAVPSHDLFLSPGTNASNISVSPLSSTSANISWTNGNGAKRLVILRAAKTINFFPEDGSDYIANASFGSGINLGDKNYVVYNGTGNSVTVTNLTPGLVYHVRVIEYNQSSSTGNHALYQLGGNPVKHFTTVGQSDVTLSTGATNGTISQSLAGSNHAIGSTIVLIALASPGYMFSGWSGSISGTKNPVEVTMDANKTITANFVTYVPHYVLNTYPNEGRIAVSKAGYSFPEGTSLNFTAVDSSYNRSLYVWPEQGVTLNQTSTVMTENKALSAWWAFSREAESASTQSAFSPFQVLNDPTASRGSYIVVPNGTGNVSSPPSTGVLSYKYNNESTNTEVVNVWLRVKTPTTGDDNLYIKWDNGSYSTITLPVNSSWTWVKAVNSKSLTPGMHTLYFARKEDGMAIDKMYFTGDLGYVPNNELSWHPLFVNAVNGSVALSPANEVFMDTKFCHIYRSGTTVQLTATPKQGYQFIGWGGAVSGSANPVNVLVTDEKNVTANFAPLAVSYTLTTNNVNGTVVRSPNATSYASTTQVELTAIPNAGYQFAGWSGDASGLINPISISMVANKTITANFTPVGTQQFTLTTSATNGSITKSPNASSYASGTLVQLTAIPNSGYQFTGWSGALTGNTNPSSITMDANKSVTANFIAISGSDFCFEAESASGQSQFAPYQVLNDENASGGQYIVVPNGTGNQSNSPSNSIATYTFNVTQSGTYYIWMRVLAPTTNDNSLLIATDGGSFSSFTPGTYTSWTWKKWSSSKSFAVGTHSVSLARNEDGLQLDKILITKSSSTPTGNGCTVNMRTGALADETEPELITLALVPNPAVEDLMISTNLPEDDMVTIAIYNSLGHQVDMILSETLSSGYHEFQYDVSNLPSGVYFVKLTTRSGSVVKTLLRN